MTNKNIKKLRIEIDEIDNKILRLIIQRSSVAKKIGTFKDVSKSFVDKKREKQVLDRLLKLHKGPYPKDSITRLWREIFYSSTKIQQIKQRTFHPKRVIDEIAIYKGGTSKIAGRKNIIKLSSNESPFGPSKLALKSYEKTSSKLSRYPELTALSLQKVIADKFDINHEQIICGTGSDEVLIFSALAFCAPGDEIIHAIHGFEMYSIITKYVGAESVLASEDDYKISTKSILDNINSSTKLIFIANPNNPTGTYLNRLELKSLIKKIPNNIIIVIDTAYAEFADADDYDKSFDLANTFKNVLITRTFSKAYSLAGIRLGWGYGSKSLIEILKKLRPPFNVTPGAIAAGISALKDEKHLKKVVSHNTNIKNWFIDEINKIGFVAYKTQANFIFIIIPRKRKQNALLVNNYLLSKGIAIRYLGSYGLKNAVRITLGVKKELQKTILMLKEFIKNNG